MPVSLGERSQLVSSAPSGTRGSPTRLLTAVTTSQGQELADPATLQPRGFCSRGRHARSCPPDRLLSTPQPFTAECVHTCMHLCACTCALHGQACTWVPTHASLHAYFCMRAPTCVPSQIP